MERSRSIPDELRVMSPAAAVTIKPPTALDRHARLDAE
jgi:hypothetical protein